MIKGRGYALRQWKEEGIVVYFFSPPLSCTAKQVFICFLLYPNYSISLGTIFSFSIILIRRLKNSTWLNDDGMAKTNRIQAACAFSSDMMSSVMPSFPRFSIRGLYLCLFLSCLVIPNNSRKPNVTSFLYSFPWTMASFILSSLPASNIISSLTFFLMFRPSSLVLQSSCLIVFLASILFLLK